MENKLIKIGTTKENRRGATLINSFCEVKFNENLIAEVEEKFVEALLDKDRSLFLVEEGYEEHLKIMEEKDKEELIKINKAINLQKEELVSKIAAFEEEIAALKAENLKLKATAKKVTKTKTTPTTTEVPKNEEVKTDVVVDDKLPRVLSEEAKKKAETLRKRTEEQLKEELSKKKLPELRTLAESYSLPKEEWENLDKAGIVNYLISK